MTKVLEFLGLSKRQSDIRQAIYELQSMSDRELDDIGVSRMSIVDRVKGK